MERPLKTLLARLAAAFVLASGINAASAADTEVGALTIHQPWTRATPAGAPAGGAYLTITNSGSTADRLMAGSSPVAGVVQIHEMAMVDNTMTMRELPDGLTIPAGETAVLKPGGFHVMLMELSAPLVEGTMVPVTLVFENAGSVTLDFPVAALGAKEPPDAGAR